MIFLELYALPWNGAAYYYTESVGAAKAARADDRLLLRGPWIAGNMTVPHRLVLRLFNPDTYVVAVQYRPADGKSYFADGNYYPWRYRGDGDTPEQKKKQALLAAAARFHTRLMAALEQYAQDLMENPP